MFGYMRRIAQVTILTFVLVFGSLLVVGSFDTPGWSHAHDTDENYGGFTALFLKIHWGDEHYKGVTHSGSH